MNKNKALLLVLPALLVLSSCQAAPKAKDNNLFLEDTLAHEEIFDANALKLNPKRANDDPVVHPDEDDPAIGIQSMVEDGKKSFRFVAAVTLPNNSESFESITATWTRTVSNPNGSTYAMDTDTVEVTTAYTSLSTNGDPYTIQQFNAAHGDSDYTHFVVYTLRNIPTSTYGDYFVCAYLSLSNGGKTKAVATKVNESKQYAFDASNGYYYLDGVIGGESKIVEPDTVGGDNKAEFDNVSFSEGDNFVIKGFINTKLTICASDYLKGSTNPIRHYFDSTSNSITSVFGGQYDLFINHSSELWLTVDSVTDTNRYLYCYIENDFNYFGDSGYPVLWVFDSQERAGNTSYWQKFEGELSANKWLKTSAKIDTSRFDSVILVRMHNATPNWDNKTTQSQNMTLDSDHAKDCIYSSGDWDHQSYSWGLRVVF